MHTHLDPAQSEMPLILLASDNPRLGAHLRLALNEHGLTVKFAPGYREIEPLAATHEKAIVLLEVSRQQSVEAAVELALRIKRSNANQFVGYLADDIFQNSGLTGDGIFPRNAQCLTRALRNHFRLPD